MIPDQIKIVRPSIADAPMIAALAAKTFTDTFGGKAHYAPEIIGDYTANSLTPLVFEKYLSDRNHSFFVIKVDDANAGFAQLVEREPVDCIKPRRAIYLNRFYLDKAYHRRGLGTILMKKCFAEATRLSYTWMWLSVWEHNHQAQAFYAHHGFSHFGEWEWPFESLGVRYIDRDLIYAREIPVLS